jgi:dGTPase
MTIVNCRPLDEESIYTNKHASLSGKSKGRLKSLEPDGYRTEYQRDVHRILYSQPFRRLRHKTQVFFLPNNDHICTRLEHVLHVSSASRTVARLLKFNEDLTEAIGLGHDIGHAPFGHHGEAVLNKISSREKLDFSFQHEIHGLRVVDKLAAFDREPGAGLNLTYEVRDGIISHCGESFKKERIICPDKSKIINLHDIKCREDAGMPSTMEGCIVRMVDKITYAGRDVEDAIAAELIDKDSIPLEIRKTLGENNGAIIGNLLEDLIDFCQMNPGAVGLSEEKHQALVELIDFNYNNIYRHDRLEKYKKQATHAIEELFNRLFKDLDTTERFENRESLPDVAVYNELHSFIKQIGYTEKDSTQLIILDFISGMTDNYLVSCLDQIFVPKNIT